LAEYGLPVWFFLNYNKFAGYGRCYVRACGWDKFEACSRPGFSQFRVWAAQIFENLVGCSKEEFVSTLSQPGRFYKLTRYNESLIPAQNQRWRRA
jgi:hypothetical protein